MGTTTNNVMPLAKCPHCGEEIQIDDYYELRGGETVTCSDCGEVMHVVEVEAVMYVTLSTKAEAVNVRVK